jgi:thermitase
MLISPAIFVGFAKGVGDARARAILRAAVPGAVLEPDFARMEGVYRVHTPLTSGFDVLEAANALAARDDVRFAEPDLLLHGVVDNLPNDEQFFRCWGLHSAGQNTFAGMPDSICQNVFGANCGGLDGGIDDWDIDAPEAWTVTAGDPSIIAVVFDAGVQLDHPDLGEPVMGNDFTGGLAGGHPVGTCDNHGTAVAGALAARKDNSIGVAGVAPGCTLASARVFWFESDAGCSNGINIPAGALINGLDWAQSIGARVTNHSYGIGAVPAALQEKLSDTRDAGMIHFASAGNNGAPPIGVLAALDTVNAVAMLAYLSPGLQTSSSYGEGLAFCAPGGLIRTTDRTGDDGYVGGWGDPALDDYTFATGTSFASPVAAGVAALILSVEPGFTPDEVERIMAASAVDLGQPGYDTRYGWGFVNAARAVALAQCIAEGGAESGADCNGNGIDDACEIAAGIAHDVDGSGVPDACEMLTVDDFAPSSLPDCDLPAGAWGWPAQYVYAGLCEDQVGQFSIVANSSFDPAGTGNSIAMDVGDLPGPRYLPRLLEASLHEADHPLVVAAFDIWVPEEGVRGGNVYVGGNHGGGGWSSGDRGPQIGWQNDGSITAAGHGTLMEAYPVGAWQSVRLEIDLADDTYDVWWALRGEAPIRIGTDLSFHNGSLLDHIDRLTFAYFAGGPTTGPARSYLADVVVSGCPADTNLDGTVDVDDLVAVILAWGGHDPAADTDNDGVVGVDDLVAVILAWGPCGG